MRVLTGKRERKKPGKISENFLSNSPPADNEMFPHPGSVFRRDRIASEITQTRVNYKKVLGTGR